MQKYKKNKKKRIFGKKNQRFRKKKSTLRRTFVSSIRQNKSLTVTFVETVNNNKPQKDIKYLLCRRGVKELNLISGAGDLRHGFQAVDTGC
jgi:hypothetical protein